MIGENPNPFVQKEKRISVLRCMELAIGAFFLLPFRLVAVALGLIGCYIFARIGLSCRGHDSSEKPISGWRKVIAVNGISFITRITLLICGFYCVKVKGPTPAPAYVAPVYIAAPKTSLLDDIIPLLIKVSPVFQYKVREWPIIGSISKAMMSVFYKGDSYDSDMLDEMKTRAKVSGWFPIMLFPEEAYTNGRTLIHFPTDLFQVLKPVQPVLISCSHRVRNNTIQQSLTVLTLLSILCTFKHSITIEYLDVVYPDANRESEKQYSLRVREQLADALFVNTSEHSKEDVQLMKYARVLGMPPLSGVVQFMSLKRDHDNLTLATAVKELIRFSQIDRRNRGVITQADFAYFLKESPDEIYYLFKKYNLDSNGELTFKSFLEEHLQQINGPITPMLSPVEDGKERFPRSRSSNLLLQRHSISGYYDNGTLM